MKSLANSNLMMSERKIGQLLHMRENEPANIKCVVFTGQQLNEIASSFRPNFVYIYRIPSLQKKIRKTRDEWGNPRGKNPPNP